MSVRRIVPDIAAADPSSGKNFFVDVLGLEVAMDLGWVVTYASPANPNAQLTVFTPEGKGPQPDYSVEVADVDACHARACAGSQEIVYPLTTEAWKVRRFFVRDPHGRIANVLSHVG